MRTVKTLNSADALISRWRALIAASASAKQEVDARHPLRLLFGVDDYQRPLFAVMTHVRPHEPELSSEAVATHITHRADGLYSLLLSLNDSSLFEVFAQLCDDLASRSASATDEATAMDAIYSALAEWQHLLRAPRPQHLSLEALRGLVGELWYATSVLSPTRSLDQTIRSWIGPNGAHQDFEFPDDTLIEVKTIHPGGSWVEIASEHQLDALGKQLTLAVVELDIAEPHTANAMSLPSLIESIRSRLSAHPEALSTFDTSLRHFEDPFTHPFYSTNLFKVRKCRTYNVSGDFPKLVPTDLPAGVTTVRYRLNVADLEPFRVFP